MILSLAISLAVAPTTIDVDGIVIRGHVRARIAVGRPMLRIDATDATAFVVARNATTLTLECRDASNHAPVVNVVIHVARLRGVATSGAVDLTVDDRSDRPLFLDLAGAGRADVSGRVPLVRTTTSGSVVADFSNLHATTIRVHARQRSRTRFSRYAHLTIVAVDDATVEYDGSRPDRVTRRNRAIVRRRRERRTFERSPDRRAALEADEDAHAVLRAVVAPPIAAPREAMTVPILAFVITVTVGVRGRHRPLPVAMPSVRAVGECRHCGCD